MSEEVIDTPLDNVLSGESAEVVDAPLEEITETVTEEAEPTVDTEEVEAQAETETTDAPTASEESVEDLKNQVKAFQTKADDEKGKRQALQQKIEQWQQQQQTQEAPDPYAEPDKAIDHAVSKVEQRFQNKLLDMSELNAKNRHEKDGDFDVMTDLFFNKMAVENPALNAEALAQVDPYEYIYRTAKNHTDMAQLNEAGGVEGYRENLEKELRAKWDAEQTEKTKEAVEQKITESIPGSLSTQRAAGSNQTRVFEGDKPLNKIVGKR